MKLNKLSVMVVGLFVSLNAQAGFWDWLVPTAHAPDQIHAEALSRGVSGDEIGLVKKLIATNDKDIERKFKNAKNDLVYAQLSAAVYGDNPIPEGWEKLDVKLPSFAKLVGFSGGVYKNTKTGNIVLAFAGTETSSIGEFIPDAVTDVHITTGLVTQQQQIAIGYAEEVIQKYGSDIVVTGHSLGGNLAQTVAIHFGLNAVTFNSAAVGNTTELLGTKEYGFIRNYLMTGDIIHPVSKIFGLTGKNYGEDIYIDADENAIVEHSINILIKNLQAMGNFYDYYQEHLRNKYGSTNCLENLNMLVCKPSHANQMLRDTSRRTQAGTSHFGTPNFPLYSAPSVSIDTAKRVRDTIQEKPHLPEGSQIVHAPADIVLSWGNQPADLDSHLTGPISADST